MFSHTSTVHDPGDFRIFADNVGPFRVAIDSCMVRIGYMLFSTFRFGFRGP